MTFKCKACIQQSSILLESIDGKNEEPGASPSPKIDEHQMEKGKGARRLPKLPNTNSLAADSQRAAKKNILI